MIFHDYIINLFNHPVIRIYFVVVIGLLLECDDNYFLKTYSLLLLM